jgi:hypothetical protein
MRISEIAVSRSIKIQVGQFEPMEHFVSVKAEIKDESELEEAYSKLTQWADEKIGFQRRILNEMKAKQSK